IVDDEICWVFGGARPDFRDDGRIVWYGSILDITAQKELEERLRQIAVTDELTGSANRRQFMELLSREFFRYKRNGPGYAVILFDFDWFKQVNDRFGHNVGDLVLKETTRVLQDELRASDTLGRVGGEEFAILLPDSDMDSARQLAERLRQTIARHRFEGTDATLQGTITCGVAVADPDDDQSNT
ncbi:GGDEF domain-containing protein, partial [Streptomyces chitinivorans]|uniref:GGDEF domain-containing protein n=1 Tax=Streptomyces chitinivorans TaxID=1257027 RepID=UPI0031E852EA